MDTNFDLILEELKKIHETYPTLRFGLVVQAAMDSHKKKKNMDVSDITSKDFLTGIKKYSNVLKYKHKGDKIV